MTTTTRFTVFQYTTCSRCNGTGETAHNLKKVIEANPGLDPNIFWRTHGVTFHQVNQPVTCSDCGGAGELRSEIDLTEALAGLGLLATAPAEGGHRRSEAGPL